MTESKFSLNTTLSVGLIQTDTNSKVAWKEAESGNFRMDVFEAKRSWAQIKSALKHFSSLKKFPEIILLPELAIPRHKIEAANRYISKKGGILIAGLDYKVNHNKNRVSNQAIVTVAGGSKNSFRHKGTISKFIGKTYPAPEEKRIIAKAKFQFKSDCTVWLFNSKKLGRFGVTICYDLLDLERALMYRSKVHHLFVIAYNKDIDTFYHLAESLCRTLYCNVVICNTGFYGGSLAIKPYNSTWKRTVYRHEGENMDTYQVVELPLRTIEDAQNGLRHDGMKNLPPGFDNEKSVEMNELKI